MCTAKIIATRQQTDYFHSVHSMVNSQYGNNNNFNILDFCTAFSYSSLKLIIYLFAFCLVVAMLGFFELLVVPNGKNLIVGLSNLSSHLHNRHKRILFIGREWASLSVLIDSYKIFTKNVHVQLWPSGNSDCFPSCRISHLFILRQQRRGKYT